MVGWGVCSHLPLPSRAEGPLSQENPQSSADLRLLCAGKFLDNNCTLKGGLAWVAVAHVRAGG